MVGEERIFFRAPEANVAFVARIRSAISADRLRAALDRVQAAHPLLASRCDADTAGEVWFTSDSSGAIPLTVIETSDLDGWITAVQEQHRIAFRFASGPLLRCVLVKTPDECQLVLFGQHVICDGLSLVYVMDEVLRLLAGPDADLPPEQTAPLLVAENLGLPKSGVGGRFANILKSVFIARFNRQWRTSGLRFDEQDFLAVHEAFTAAFRYEMLVTGLSESETDRLVQACRSHGVTVNSFLCSAFLGARLDVDPTYGNAIEVVAVDVRGRVAVPIGKAVGCFIGDVTLGYRYDSQLDIWGNALAMQAQVRRALDRSEDLNSLADISRLSTALIEGLTFARHLLYSPDVAAQSASLKRLASPGNVAMRLARQGQSEYPGLVITNLGRLALDEHACETLSVQECFFAPSAVPVEGGGLILGVATVRGRVTITSNAMTGTDGRDDVRLEMLRAISTRAADKIKRVCEEA